MERQKSVKPKTKKNTDELQPKEHVKELSGSSSPMYKHSRDPSASSEVSEEGTRQYCKALNYNLAKTPEDLMFVKGDIIQIVERISENKWLVPTKFLYSYHFSGLLCSRESTLANLISNP